MHKCVSRSRVGTISDAAKLLKIHENTAYRLAQTGTIPAVRFGGAWRVDLTILEERLRAGCAMERQ